MKTNSNSYTIVYSIVIVVVVAFLLAFVNQALKATQEANVALDTKKQILNSLNIRNLTDAQAEAEYAKVVKEEKKNNKGLTYYVANVNGETKYIFKMKGRGLWDEISAYVSVNADKATIYGAYFNHKGETAGLGAEIKDNVEWQKSFNNKRIFAASDVQHTTPIISVEKKVEPQNRDHQVDGITGATLTSNGVRDMLQESFKEFADVLTPSASAAQPSK